MTAPTRDELRKAWQTLMNTYDADATDDPRIFIVAALRVALDHADALAAELRTKPTCLDPDAHGPCDAIATLSREASEPRAKLEQVREPRIIIDALRTRCEEAERERDRFMAGVTLNETAHRMELVELREKCMIAENRAVGAELALSYANDAVAAMRSENAALREDTSRRITVALELIAELRSYTKNWDYKYGADWDAMRAEVAVRKATP